MKYCALAALILTGCSGLPRETPPTPVVSVFVVDRAQLLEDREPGNETEGEGGAGGIAAAVQAFLRK